MTTGSDKLIGRHDQITSNGTWFMSPRQSWVLMYIAGKARYSPRIRGVPRKNRNWSAIKWRKGCEKPVFIGIDSAFSDDITSMILKVNERIVNSFRTPALENQR